MASVASRLSLVCAMALSPALMAQEGDEDIRVIIKKAIDCEGDDCEEGLHQVFIGESGNTQIRSGDGNVWVQSGHQADGEFMIHARHGKGGFLGVSLTDLSDELRTHFGVSGAGGVMVSKVVDDSAAFRAGLSVGDIISAVDGEAVSSARSLGRAISAREDGEQVTLEVWRDGQLQNLSATLETNGNAGNVMKMGRQIRIECDDDEEDCNFDFADLDLGDLNIDLGDLDHKVMMIKANDFDCGSDDCRIEVQCTNESDCVCTVNGEETDCEELGH